LEEERAERPDLTEGLIIPDEPEGRAPEENGTAAVVLGAAAGTIAGSFLGPVGAVVGAVAGGALAGAMGGTEAGAGDLRTDGERTGMQHEDRGQSLAGTRGDAMNHAMYEMGMDDGDSERGYNQMANGNRLRDSVRNGVNEISKNESAGIAVGGTAGAVVGSILGPVGTAVGAVAGGIMGDRFAEARQHGGNTGNAASGGSPRQVVEMAARTCAGAKEQLIAQMNQVPTHEGRTVLQMAINALNLSVVELETASGSLQ